MAALADSTNTSWSVQHQKTSKSFFTQKVKATLCYRQANESKCTYDDQTWLKSGRRRCSHLGFVLHLVLSKTRKMAMASC